MRPGSISCNHSWPRSRRRLRSGLRFSISISTSPSWHVIDEQGRVYAFWLGWDDRRQSPAFTEWEEVEPESNWLESTEYRQARERVGLN